MVKDNGGVDGEIPRDHDCDKTALIGMPFVACSGRRYTRILNALGVIASFLWPIISILLHCTQCSCVRLISDSCSWIASSAVRRVTMLARRLASISPMQLQRRCDGPLFLCSTPIHH